jgi:hypothetical protein
MKHFFFLIMKKIVKINVCPIFGYYKDEDIFTLYNSSVGIKLKLPLN